MKVFKHLNVLFMAQAAMIAAIYVAFHGTGGDDRRDLRSRDTACRAFCLRRGPGPFIRGSDHPSCIYPGSDPRIIYRMPHQQYPRRMHSPGYYFRKPCDPDRRGIYMDAEEPQQISGPSSAHHRECAHRAFCAEVRIHGAASDPIHDADRRYRGSDLLCGARTDPAHCAQQV